MEWSGKAAAEAKRHRRGTSADVFIVDAVVFVGSVVEGGSSEC